MRKLQLLLLITFISMAFGFIQQGTIQEILSKLRNFTQRNYQEKVYVQTDSDIYYAGDVIWFSTSLLDVQTHAPSLLSQIVHVKLFSSSGTELASKKIQTRDGRGNADILLSDTLSTGVYHLVAYTKWMKNFGQDYIYKKPLYVVNQMAKKTEEDKNAIGINIAFFPEGGTILESIENKVGFIATDNSGEPINPKGHILNDKGDTIQAISTFKFGRGSFTILPKPRRNYHLVFTQNDQTVKLDLPQTRKQGISLNVNTDRQGNTNVSIAMSKDYARSNKSISLISHCRGEVTFAAAGVGATKNIITIPKNKLAPGVNQLTIFDQAGAAVAGRLVFVSDTQKPTVSISSLQPVYAKKSKVAIQLNLQVAEEANVSISVHDRPQLGRMNIDNYLQISSELGVSAEEASFCFAGTDSAQTALENLMLTSSWDRFLWKDVLDEKNTKLKYPYEKYGVLFRGKLIHKETNEPVKDTSVIFSILDEHPNLTFQKLGNQAEFAFPLDGISGKSLAFVTILDEPAMEGYRLIDLDKSDDFEITFSNTAKASFPDVLYEHFELKKKDDKILKNYRIYAPELFSNPEQVLSPNYPLNSMTNPDHTIDTDEFIQLTGLKEMMDELAPSAKIKRWKGADHIFVYQYEPMPEVKRRPAIFNDLPATCVLNGVPIFDDELMFGLDYSKIDHTGIYTGQYDISDHRFHGFVSVTTKDIFSDENPMLRASNATIVEGISHTRTFKSPDYMSDYQNLRRLPDLRHLLHWQPNVKLEAEKSTEVLFYTSDVQNTFYITIEGITESGKTIHLTKTFEVSSETP
ncbi:MAG: hypothetical protein ABJG41_20185 [Cyclobacteriaceae bacterium]